MKKFRRPDRRAVSIGGIISEAAIGYLISIMVSGVYLARITTRLGFSDSLTGIISSFLSLGCLAQLASLFMFRKLRSPKRAVLASYVVSHLMHIVVYLTPALDLPGTAKTAIFLICFCGSNLISNLVVANKTDWMYSLIDDRRRGRFTAANEMISLLTGMIFTYIMGYMIDSMEAAGNHRLVFYIGAGVVFLLSAMRFGVTEAVEDVPAARRGSIGIKETIGSLLGDRMVRRVVTVCMLWHVANSCATPFYGAYQINELGFSMTFVSVLSIIYSVVRMAFSPLLGRYADKRSFSHMSFVCFIIVGAGFFVNCFTTPANGKVFYTAYYCLYAVSMGGINSSLTNLVFEHVKGANRRDALAINAALGGVAGFAATCAMSPIVAHIQNSGNMFMGMNIYAAQFVSGAAFVIVAFLTVYMKMCVIPAHEKNS